MFESHIADMQMRRDVARLREKVEGEGRTLKYIEAAEAALEAGNAGDLVSAITSQLRENMCHAVKVVAAM